MRTTTRCFALCATLAAALAAGPGCSESGTSEEDLTSLRAQSREITFEGIVYVEPGVSDEEILALVHAQTQTAFGPLRTLEIGVNKRELEGVDPATFKKRDVLVVDTEVEGDEGTPMVEVRYTYVDMAVVPKEMSRKSTLKLALLRPDYASESERILEECTTNDSHARDFATSLWYVFEPSLSSCQTAIRAEQDLVTAARRKVDGDAVLALAETRRLYLPITARLGPDETNKKPSWPEYDRLYRGGVREGKLVISLINGLIDHDESANGIHEDSGYSEWLDTLQQAMEAHPGFAVVDVEGGVDLSSYELSTGKEVTGLSFADLAAIDDGTYPSGLTWDEKNELERLVGERVSDRWITLELPTAVQIGDAAPQDLGIQIMTFFGHAESVTPFKHAIKNSDVFLYNGHSMIGFGPLDPKNFTAEDFPSSYQILFIDGCVSYNYYEADYIPLKEGGTKNLDLITNAIESPAWRSGYALGEFIVTLINGQAATYRELLESAEATGSGLRVVDGELDNEYDPARTPIVLTDK